MVPAMTAAMSGSSSCTTRLAPGTAAATRRRWASTPAVVQVQSGREAKRAAQLDLQLGRGGLFRPDDVGEDVDVGGQRRAGPPEVLAGAVHDPPAVGLHVDGEALQQ